MTDKTPEFISGLFVKAPHDKAPDFVKAAISIKRSELLTWLTTRTEDWINLDVKESKKGVWYASINDWQPRKQDAYAAQNQPPQGSNQGQQTSGPANQLDEDQDIPW